jgi:hypothetical protein
MKNNCKYCNKEFKNSIMGRKKEYCSKSCVDKFKKGIPKNYIGENRYICLSCNKSFISTKKRKYCNKECSKGYHIELAKNKRKQPDYTTKKYSIICTICNKEHKASNKKIKYCKDCLKVYQKEKVKTNPNCQRRNFEIYRGKEHMDNWDYKNWRKQIFKKDFYKCVYCGASSVGSNLNAHHLYSYANFIEKRYDINNGVTLCKTCHIDFHRIYKFGKNTKEQFIEFLERRQINANTIKANRIN